MKTLTCTADYYYNNHIVIIPLSIQGMHMKWMSLIYYMLSNTSYGVKYLITLYELSVGNYL